MTESITRSITVTEVKPEAREFTGLFAPYNEVITVGGYKERYEAGVFSDVAEGTVIPVHYNHDIQKGEFPLGKVLSIRETDAGAEITARFSDTARGNEAYTHLKEGTLNSLSANFFPTKTRMEEDVTVYEKADLVEVSVVSRSAYPSAKISEVRSDSEPTNNKEAVSGDTDTIKMENETLIDSEARSGLADLERRFEVLSNKEVETPAPVSNIRSYGEYVQKIASLDEEALEIMRAYTGGTTADSVVANGWSKDIINVVAQGRPVFNAFSKGQWVPEGNNIEYAKLNTNTIDVASQAAEGDDLAKGKVSITTATTPKKTFGGWTEMSLQEIKRSNVNILDVAFQAMAAEYAKETEKYVRDALVAASGHVATNSLADADDWLEFVVDAAVWLDTKGLRPEFVVVSADNYKELATLTKADPYVLGRNQGAVQVTDLTGNLLSLPFILVPGSGIAAVAHSSAIKTFESPGAPFQLQDENIVNLTKQFSVYGELAVAVQDNNAIVKAA